MRTFTRVKKVALTLLKSRVRPGLRGAKRVKKYGGAQTQLDEAEIRALLAIWLDETIQRQLLGTIGTIEGTTLVKINLE